MQPNEMVDEAMGEEIDSSTGNACGDSTKSTKPMMEKRRRARINSSLNELKTILLGAMKKDTTRHSKLEKADILEMTVKYLRRLEKQRATASKINPEVINKYKAGFTECRNEVMKFLSTHEGVTVEVRTRLLSHLGTCVKSLQDEEQEFGSDEFIDIDPTVTWKPSLMHVDEPTSTDTTKRSQTISQEHGDSDSQLLQEPEATMLPTTTKSITGSVYRERQTEISSYSTPSPTSSSEISSPNMKDDHVVFPCVNSSTELPVSTCQGVHYPSLPDLQIPQSSNTNVQFHCHDLRRIPMHPESQTSNSRSLTLTGIDNDYRARYMMSSVTNEMEYPQVLHPQGLKIFPVTRNQQTECVEYPSNAKTRPNFTTSEAIHVHAAQMPVLYSQPYDRREQNAESSVKNPWRPWSPSGT